MNKNYSCDIIKDLLPGYIDGFKKLRQYTRKLKIVVGIAIGLLVFFFLPDQPCGLETE